MLKNTIPYLIERGCYEEESGNLSGAIPYFLEAGLHDSSPTTYAHVIRALGYAEFHRYDARIEGLLLDLLETNEPQAIAYACASMAKQHPLPIEKNRLLLQLMRKVPIPDQEIETRLTELRRSLLLDSASIENEVVEALAKQCQLTEGVYAVTAEEKARLEEGRVPEILQKCYFPDRPSIPQTNIASFGSIADAISLCVADQYEEFPYPLWERLPLLPQRIYPERKFTDILVAGCGTGRHALTVARHFYPTPVLAIDLSLRSLQYAQSKAQSLGLTNIQFLQGDILQIHALGKQFDLIECTGVLHHMALPFAGGQALRQVLAPGGWMHIGLYSQMGRRDVTAARKYLQEQQFPDTKEGIRQARQFLRSLPAEDPAKTVCLSQDFYTLSGCHDLLFNVQEHTFTLPEIEKMLQELQLHFVRFTGLAPGVPAFTSLSEAHAYEMQHPTTFFNMYQFWVKDCRANNKDQKT